MSEFELFFKGTPAQFWAVAEDLNSRLQQEVYRTMPDADGNLAYVRFGKTGFEPSEVARQTVYFGEVQARSVPGGAMLRVWYEDEGKARNEATQWWDMLVERMREDGWVTLDQDTETGVGEKPMPSVAIYTGGGAVVMGDVNTSGGNFTGRDSKTGVVHENEE